MRLRVSTRKCPYEFVDVDEFEIIADSGFETTVKTGKDGEHIITYKEPDKKKDWRKNKGV